MRAAVEAGATTPREVGERGYSGVDQILWRAADLSFAPQLTPLEE